MTLRFALHEGDGFRIGLPLRFDFSCFTQFRAACTRLGSARSVTLDMSSTDYMDSAGVGMLLFLRDKVQDAATIRIDGATGQPLSVLHLVNLDKLFTVCASAGK